MFYIWVAIVILLAIAEAMTINIVTIWYVISGLAAIVSSFFTNNFLIQFAIFAILGTILLITTRPIIKNFLNTKNIKTNFDRIIGMNGIVTEEIKKNSIGEVKVDGKKWSAIADKKIEIDKTVEILEINGVKVKVKEIKD
ncbi:MAG: NfeD family protein [Bacilli bacterium]|nr:NfeD family protein [Bacilli bacterium]